MKALLRKDIYVARKQGAVLLGLAFLFCLLPKMGTLANVYAVLIAVMMPLSTITYDEQCKWDKYAAMLPYTPWQIVWSKYVLTFLCLLVGAAGILLAAGMRTVYGEGPLDTGELLGNLAMLLAVLLMLDVALPAVYRFGSEKGRLVMILIMLAVLTAGMGAAKVMGEVHIPALPAPAVIALAAVLLAAATAVSFWCSLCFYIRRLNGKYA